MRRFVERVAEFFTLQVTLSRKIILENVYAFRKKGASIASLILLFIIIIMHLFKILPGRE